MKSYIKLGSAVRTMAYRGVRSGQNTSDPAEPRNSGRFNRIDSNEGNENEPVPHWEWEGKRARIHREGMAKLGRNLAVKQATGEVFLLVEDYEQAYSEI